MIQLLTLLQQTIISTLLDVDGAVYMTSAIESLPLKQQKKAIQWGLITEFAGRLLLIGFFYSLLSQNQTLFTLKGIEFTLDSISLFIIGAFLIAKSSWELYEFWTNYQSEQSILLPSATFPRLMLEMTAVNLMFSVDNIIVLSSRFLSLSFIIFVFIFSAIVRLFALEKMAQFISQYPSMRIVLLVFLILIGIELFLKGLWFEFPEEIFNAVMVIGIIFAIVDQRRRAT